MESTEVSGGLSPSGGDHWFCMGLGSCMVGNEAGQADGTSPHGPLRTLRSWGWQRRWAKALVVNVIPGTRAHLESPVCPTMGCGTGDLSADKLELNQLSETLSMEGCAWVLKGSQVQEPEVKISI